MWQKYQEQDLNQQSELKEIAEHASYSAWNLREWGNFQKYVKILDNQKHAYEKNFYQAILDVKNKKFGEA